MERKKRRKMDEVEMREEEIFLPKRFKILMAELFNCLRNAIFG